MSKLIKLNKMVFIYVLQLEQDKYYVGKTQDPKFRLETHFDSKGSVWTKKYKPINIHTVIPDCDDYDEDKYVLKYMNDKGIDNVRGGSFCEINLSPENESTIKKMINASGDKCHNCGKTGHFANKCNKTNNIEQNKKVKKIIKEKEQRCYRCNRTGHYEKDCYAKTYDNGDEISDFEIVSDDDDEEECFACSYCDKEFETLKGATFHENMYCKKKFTKTQSTTSRNMDGYRVMNINGINMYICDYCSMGFGDMKMLTTHKNFYCKK